MENIVITSLASFDISGPWVLDRYLHYTIQQEKNLKVVAVSFFLSKIPAFPLTGDKEVTVNKFWPVKLIHYSSNSVLLDASPS